MDSGNKNIDYDARRIRNIERNNNFLKSLQINEGIELETSDPKEQDDTDTVNLRRVKESHIELTSRCSEALSACTKMFPHRDEEAEVLIQYIQQVGKTLPAMLVHGPSGVGKTSICQYLLTESKTPHMSISCASYRDDSQV